MINFLVILLDAVQSIPFVIGIPFVVAIVWYVAQKRNTIWPFLSYVVLNAGLWAFRSWWNAPLACPLFQSCRPLLGGLNEGYIVLWGIPIVLFAIFCGVVLVKFNRLVSSVEQIADGQYKNGMVK